MPRSWLPFAVALHLVLAGAYAWRTPSFEGPDENSHYEYAWHLASARKLPLARTLAAARGLPQTEQVGLAHHPPLYYALLALPLLATAADDTVFGPLGNPAFGDPTQPSQHLKFRHAVDPPGVLLLLRSVSVALGALSLVLLHRLARTCCPTMPRVADLAVLLTASLPMWSFLHGVINNDVLAITAATANVLALATMLRAERVRRLHGVVIGALLATALLTKLTTLFLLPLAALAFVVRGCRDRGSRRAGAASAAIAALVVALLAGWWFLRNGMLYGDLLATSAHDAAFAPIPPEHRWTWFTSGFLPTIGPALFGRFGWFSLPPPPALVWTGTLVAALALAGLARWRLDRERPPLHGPWLLVLTLLLVFAGTAWFNWKSPQPQARLLLPAAAPAAILLAVGLLRLTNGLAGRRAFAALPPLAAIAVFVGWFAPAFAIELAPAPPSHRSLVGGIVAPTTTPHLRWRDAGGGVLRTPPTLHWDDPDAPPGTRYSLYAFDAAGRVHLATHEWTGGAWAITGGTFTLPDAGWAFLPRGVDLFLRLRRVPATTAEDPARLPMSPPWPLSVE
jgi:4-amino-4-deoxy-L-arabinose transferase-like glycosyltransferase